MNTKFIDNCGLYANVMRDADFRPIASSLGRLNAIAKKDDGKVVLETEYGEFEVSSNTPWCLREFGILTLLVKGKYGECEVDVCDVRIMAVLGKIGEAEKIMGVTKRFHRGDRTLFTYMSSETAFAECRDRGFPGCIDRFEHFLRHAYWLDESGLPVMDMHKFAELDARLVSLIPNTYRNGVGGGTRNYEMDMEHFGVALYSRYEFLPRVKEFMSAHKNDPCFTKL